MNGKKDSWIVISLSRGEKLKCNRCGKFIEDEEIDLCVSGNEAVIEVVCGNCRVY